jgi:hypothetical protein
MVQAPGVISAERPGLVHAPAAPKFDPVRVMTVPTLTLLLGVNVISGTTVKVALALSPKLPVTVTVFASALTPGPKITKDPATTPAETEHDGVPTLKPGAASVQLVSPALNPEPETVTVWPPLPELGESAIDGAVTVNVAETVLWTTLACVSATVWAPELTGGEVLTVMLPVRTPLASTLHVTAPAKKGSLGVKLRNPAQAKAPLYPEPDSVTAVPAPPFVGVNTNVDCTMKCTIAESPCDPVTFTA